MGEQLSITGVWTSNDWAQLADNTWVYGPQIQTDLRPPRTAYSQSPSYVVTEEVAPDYGDWAYLPDYGYDTYWYGGIPIFFYNIGVWNRFHPWWWHRGHQAWWWQGGHHGKRAWNSNTFNNFVRAGRNRNFVTNRANISSFNRAGAPRSFTTNRSNISPFNVNRFNTNRFGSGATTCFARELSQVRIHSVLDLQMRFVHEASLVRIRSVVVVSGVGSLVVLPVQEASAALASVAAVTQWPHGWRRRTPQIILLSTLLNSLSGGHLFEDGLLFFPSDYQCKHTPMDQF